MAKITIMLACAAGMSTSLLVTKMQAAADEKGLDELDRKILKSIVSVYNGGPVGIETLSLLLGEDRRTVEEVYEPYLVKIGFIKRTPRGRVVTELGYNHLGLEKILE